MNDHHDTLAIEGEIRNALGSAPEPDFERWRQKHAEALEILSQTLLSMTAERKKKRWTIALRIAPAMAAAAALLFILTWLLAPQRSTFAQTIEGIETAKAVTWVTTQYTRCVSAEGTHTWLKSRDTKHSYMHPGLYRTEHYDHRGELTRIYIKDTVRGQLLDLDMSQRSYEITTVERRKPSSDGPFFWINDILKNEPIEAAGQRTVDGKKVNVFRRRNLAMGKYDPRNVEDIWFDA